MLAYLKIKVVSLADEAKRIRHDEAKWLRVARHPKNTDPRAKARYFGLHEHRTKDVRGEARSANLAYGFLRGRTYRQLEKCCHTSPNVSRVCELVLRFRGDTERLDNHSRAQIDDLVKAWFAA